MRPYADEDGPPWWVVSDLDPRRQQRDHVTGVGAASLTLAAATVRAPGSVLDLGTGCGVQALHATRHARTVTGTDVAPRALATARATFALTDVDVELREGPWLEPVARPPVDPIVSNPPFVPGPARVDLVYRDSGQRGDDALAALGDLPRHLEPGGVAQLLGSWLHVHGEDWPDRVQSWLPPGVDAWILQREVADPALHVGTWQRDSGLDLAAPATRAQAGAWLDWLDSAGVEAIGFGMITLRMPERGPGTVVVEDLPGAVDDPLGPEVAGWLDRIDWLRAHAADADLLAARLAVAPGVVLERWSETGELGWTEAGASVSRMDGPRWRHEVDEPGAALLAGCRGELPLGDVVELLAFAHDLVHRRRRVGVAAGGAGAGAPRVAGARMRAVAARVTRASVTVECEIVGEITEPGLLVLLGVHREDTTEQATIMARKLHELRILDDERSLRRDRGTAAGGQPVHPLRRHPQGPPPVLGGRRAARTRPSPRRSHRRRAARARRHGGDGRVRRKDGRRVGERRAVHRAGGGLISSSRATRTSRAATTAFWPRDALGDVERRLHGHLDDVGDDVEGVLGCGLDARGDLVDGHGDLLMGDVRTILIRIVNYVKQAGRRRSCGRPRAARPAAPA